MKKNIIIQQKNKAAKKIQCLFRGFSTRLKHGNRIWAVTVLQVNKQ